MIRTLGGGVTPPIPPPTHPPSFAPASLCLPLNFIGEFSEINIYDIEGDKGLHIVLHVPPQCRKSRRFHRPKNSNFSRSPCNVERKTFAAANLAAFLFNHLKFKTHLAHMLPFVNPYLEIARFLRERNFLTDCLCRMCSGQML